MDIYTVIKWKHIGSTWMWSEEFGYHSILKSFRSRTDAVKYIREELGCIWKHGYYINKDYLYTIKKTELI